MGKEKIVGPREKPEKVLGRGMKWRVWGCKKEELAWPDIYTFCPYCGAKNVKFWIHTIDLTRKKLLEPLKRVMESGR